MNPIRFTIVIFKNLTVTPDIQIKVEKNSQLIFSKSFEIKYNTY